MNKELSILLVEDNEGDIVLTLEALKEAGGNTGVTVVKDGEAAMQYLHKKDAYINALLPDLILLDINLPKMNGKEVLVKIKEDINLKMIPVVILTTSDSEKDILFAYNHGANCYITKPSDYHQFLKEVQKIVEFWMHIVHLPNKKFYEQRD